MQEEVTQKTIALSMKTGKLTAQALQAALKKYLQHRAKGPKLHHGKQSLKQLKAHGAALTNIEVTEANIGAFNLCAKKYGVDFTLRKDKTTQPPHYRVSGSPSAFDMDEEDKYEDDFVTIPKEKYDSMIEDLLTMAELIDMVSDMRTKDVRAIQEFGKFIPAYRALPAGRRSRPQAERERVESTPCP